MSNTIIVRFDTFEIFVKWLWLRVSFLYGGRVKTATAFGNEEGTHLNFVCGFCRENKQGF
jgi:hypothetical protein